MKYNLNQATLLWVALRCLSFPKTCIVQCTVLAGEELAELAGGSTACCEMARGPCLFAWNFSVIRSTVLTAAERRSRRIMTLSLH